MDHSTLQPVRVELTLGRGGSTSALTQLQRERDRELNAHRLNTISKSWQHKFGASVLLGVDAGADNDKKALETQKEPQGRWSSPLSRCCDDCGTCCIVFGCSCIVVPQLYEREVGPPGSCRKWFGRLGLLCTINFFVVCARNAWLAATFDSWPRGSWETYWFMIDATAGSVSTLLACTAMAIVVWLLRAVRRKLRREDDIPASCCSERLDDCCLAFWCTQCVQCQLLRHLGLTWGWPLCCSNEARKRRRYTLRTTTGERPAAVADAAAEGLASPV